MSAQIFQHTHRVTYSECTVGNHIYYARYLDLLEAARGEFFRSLGKTLLAWQEAGVIFPVLEAAVRYQAPARYDDVLTIAVWLTELRGVRATFAHRITDASGRLILEAETKHACTNLAEKPCRPPAELVAKLKPFVQPAAAEG
ncbi:MAG: acyl-CoA thioesterase [Verrucomicrobia bacterium]|nr:acyl-CoA thioesterase [Verrucomicrobiota bacterium]